MSTARRVTVIAHELRGFRPVGGMGTATTLLALALARLGHSVEILLGKHPPASIDPHWGTVYREASVRIRPVPLSDEPVEPWHFAHAHAVALGLRADPPDVVIAHDLGAPGYAALRLRQAGLAFADTLFVVFCHGPRRYVLDLSPTVAVGDLQTVVGVSILEQAAVELADVVVSPSAYLVDWMRARGWQLPERTRVIPYFTESTALGVAGPPPARRDAGRIRRLAFFGRVDEKKGVKVLTAALNALEPELIEGLELDFVGKTTRTWTHERVESLLSAETRRTLGHVAFETELDQPQALERLHRAGTLVVMPSLQENSPNTVYECLEHGIPFIAADVGGVRELIAPEDRPRVLFQPTPESLHDTLRRLLGGGVVPAPARPGFEAGEPFARWAEVVVATPRRPENGSRQPDERVDVVVVVARRSGEAEASASRCLAALKRQSYSNFETVVAASRQEGLAEGSAPYVAFLNEDDVPSYDWLETLVRARRATKADAVGCGLRIASEPGAATLHFFEGDPGGRAALVNGYGTVALLRRAALAGTTTPWPLEGDADWPLLARLAAAGASIVSIPLALVERRGAPGSAESDPEAALLVAQELERTLPDPLRGSARVAAGLAASGRKPPAVRQNGAVDRAADILRRLTRRSSRRRRRDSPR
jgi:glycosyltransferase involved in cell wall biosynthesis